MPTMIMAEYPRIAVELEWRGGVPVVLTSGFVAELATDTLEADLRKGKVTFSAGDRLRIRINPWTVANLGSYARNLLARPVENVIAVKPEVMPQLALVEVVTAPAAERDHESEPKGKSQPKNRQAQAEDYSLRRNRSNINPGMSYDARSWDAHVKALCKAQRLAPEYRAKVKAMYWQDLLTVAGSLGINPIGVKRPALESIVVREMVAQAVH